MTYYASILRVLNSEYGLNELKRIVEPTRAQVLLDQSANKLNLTDYEKAILEKTGYIRWHSMIHWFSVDCVKAGFIRKSGGKWSLTEYGDNALQLMATSNNGIFGIVKYKAFE